MKRALIVMARHPTPGETKTRLCPPFRPDQAAALYERFLLQVFRTVRSVPGIARFVAYTPADRIDYFREIAPDFELMPQQGDGLGERLDVALSAVLARGFDGVVVLGSDAPTLPLAHLAAAFDLLEQVDIVLGPCEDGGYYLIGAKRPQPRLLREVRMSTPTVLQDTLELAAQEGLAVGLAPRWYDVDTIEDLRRMKADSFLSA